MKVECLFTCEVPVNMNQLNAVTVTGSHKIETELPKLTLAG